MDIQWHHGVVVATEYRQGTICLVFCKHLLKWIIEIKSLFGFSFRSRGTVFCEGTLRFEEQVHWRRHYQDALEFLVDNIFVVFAGKVFQQIIGIPMGTNCAPLLADIFLYSYEAEFIQSLLSAGKKRLASQFNFTYRYIDDVLSINNPDFENYLGQMYPPELEIKDTTESNTSASYLDLLLSIGSDGQLHTSLYDKRDDFNFHITNFPFLSSNIPSSPAYGVFISQLIRYARACSSYECFILRAMRLSNKLLGQGYVKERLKSSLRKFYGRYGDLTKQYEVPLSRMLHDILDDDHIQWHPPLIGHYTYFWPLLIYTLLPNLTFYLIVQGFHRTYATGAACQQRTLVGVISTKWP